MNLNEEQKRAINHFTGPAIVIAGPGTGKTSVIEERVKKLLNQGVKPENILVTTFTNKAADELKFRILGSLRNIENIENLHISTIHSLCESILKEYGEYTPLGFDFDIMDEIDEAIFLEENKYRLHIVRRRGETEKQLLNLISWAKGGSKESAILEFFNKCIENDVDPDELIDKIREISIESNSNKKNENYINRMTKAAEAYKKYLELMIKEKKINFSNLQRLVLHLLRENNKVAKELRDRYKFIIVDEYQDINPIQAKIIHELAKPKFNLFVVGDEDQSIYGFRGADIEQFRSFERRYKKYGVKVYKLKINYRSTKNIVVNSEEFIKPHRRINKEIIAKRNNKVNPFFLIADNPAEEEEKIVELIKKLKKEQIVDNYSDIAVLMKENKLIYKIAAKLDREEIKYSIGRKKINDHWLFKEIMKLMKYVYTPIENITYLENKLGYALSNGELTIKELINMNWWDASILESRILNLKRETIETLRALNEEDLREFTLNELKKMGIPEEDAIKIDKLNNIYRKLKDGKITGLLKVFYEILELNPLMKEKIKKIEKNNLNETDKKELIVLSKLSKILNSSDRLRKNKKGSFVNLMSALINTLLSRGYLAFEFNDEGGVHLMTVHQAKGLEFPVVIIPHASEFKEVNNRGSPLVCPLSGEYDSEEIYRVFYVGMTRARDLLIIGNYRKKRNKKTKSVVSELNFDYITKVNEVKDIIGIIKNFKVLKSNKKKKSDVSSLSYTSLKTYLDCPLRYNLIYVQSLVTPQIFQQFKGILYHRILYKINKEFKERHGKIDERTVKTIINEAIGDYKDMDKEEIHNIMLNYYKNFLKKKVKRIIDIERNFNYKIKGKNTIIEGRYDMLYEDREKGVTLVDFKAQRKSGLEDVGMLYQFAVYFLALDNEYPNLNFMAYTIEDGELTEFKREDIIKLKIENIIKKKVLDGINNNEFKHKKNKFCKYCAFREFCGVKDDDREKR